MYWFKQHLPALISIISILYIISCCLGSSFVGYDSVVYIDLLHKNESIGTASLFWQCYWFHYYRSLGFCELLMLRQSDFRKMRIYKEFPVSYGVLKASAARRRWRQLFRLLVMLPRKSLLRLAEDLMMIAFSNDTPTHATASLRSLSPHPFVRTASSDRHMNPESPPHESGDVRLLGVLAVLAAAGVIRLRVHPPSPPLPSPACLFALISFMPSS